MINWTVNEIKKELHNKIDYGGHFSYLYICTFDDGPTAFGKEDSGVKVKYFKYHIIFLHVIHIT